MSVSLRSWEGKVAPGRGWDQAESCEIPMKQLGRWDNTMWGLPLPGSRNMAAAAGEELD